MLIDWFTVVAQAINFAILVWLMKRFLYQPVLDAIDTREKHIAAELSDADAKKAEARHERDAFEQKNANFDLQRAALLAVATDAAKAEGQRLIGEAARSAEAAASKLRSALQGEAAALRHTLVVRMRREVFAIARETLADLATVGLEERVSEAFIERLRRLDGVARDGLAQAIRTADSGALVRSAFELPQRQRAAIGHALNETFSADVTLRFETVADLVAGIEMTVNGQKLEWNIGHHIESLEKSVDAMVDEAASVAGRPPAFQLRPDATSAPDARPVPLAA